MVQFGFSARYFNNYSYEVALARKNGFDFLQIWFDNQGLNAEDPRTTEEISKEGFPAIIHLVLDITEYQEFLPEIKKKLKQLGHQELIIHPQVKQSNPDNQYKNSLFAQQIKSFSAELGSNIKLYIENNSKVDGFMAKPAELKAFFDINPNCELVLDVAHLENFSDIHQILKFRKPSIINISDRQLSTAHQHLLLGKGDLDFEALFKQHLPIFEGRIIFENIKSDEDTSYSLNYIKALLAK